MAFVKDESAIRLLGKGLTETIRDGNPAFMVNRIQKMSKKFFHHFKPFFTTIPHYTENPKFVKKNFNVAQKFINNAN